MALATAGALFIVAVTLYCLAIPAQEQGTRLAPRLTNSVGMEFVLIPAGTFTMGAIDSYPDEQPIRTVRISQPFYLGKYEVTQAQWEAVMGYNPSAWRGQRHLPVEQVSWEDVQEFLRRLNAEEGVARYRVPTEAEWEYAARAGATTPYSFGSDVSRLDEYAWYGGNAAHTSHPVGQLKPNAWGLHDMHGNVQEWVQDGRRPYQVGTVTDPQGPTSGSLRIYLGGSWDNLFSYCRAAYRFFRDPYNRSDTRGFRLLRMVE